MHLFIYKASIYIVKLLLTQMFFFYSNMFFFFFFYRILFPFYICDKDILEHIFVFLSILLFDFCTSLSSAFSFILCYFLLN